MLPAPLPRHLSRHLRDETATLALGAALAAGLEPGMVLYLRGDLGSGKTTFTRGVLAALGHVGKVKSPTYTLVEPYELSRLDFYHFDLYRLRDAGEWTDAGFDEVCDARSVCAIEWPEKALERLPPADLLIDLRPQPNDDGNTIGRNASLTATTERGARCLAAMTR